MITDKDIYCENNKLTRAIKFMFYLSVIMPYNFMIAKSRDDILKDIIFHEDEYFDSAEKRESVKAKK